MSVFFYLGSIVLSSILVQSFGLLPRDRNYDHLIKSSMSSVVVHIS